MSQCQEGVLRSVWDNKRLTRKNKKKREKAEAHAMNTMLDAWE